MSVSFEIEPIGPTIGAEIHGLDLTQQVDQETASSLKGALIEHKVIYARDQHISPAQQVAFGRLFGELEVHPFMPDGEFPEIVVLDNHKDNPVLSTDTWHSDTTFRDCPTRYSILRCLELPKVGGDTLWADMCAAYDGLSAPLKTMIHGLTATHDFKPFRALYGDSDQDREKLRNMEQLYPNPTHPMVRTNPESGRKALFVNPHFTLRINELTEQESDALLKLLFEQTHVPEYQFRLRWKPGTMVLWDNASTQHYAANDYYPNRRRMERVAVMGDKPY
ncbi:MAG: taurine dioxygenase [Rhodospirillaceae bacterium]|jgi:taurine dioxygenase|nr:taurine dioxygenase [Rhodospirillaceae bacterium]